MTLHPLFAGFTDISPYALGDALGFAVHVDAARGPLPSELPPEHAKRLQVGGELAGFHCAGGWEAPGVAHCLMFVKPLTALASACWLAGLGHRQVGMRASYLYSGAQALGDLEVAAYAALGEEVAGWPRLQSPDTELFVEAFALLLDGFMLQTGNAKLPLDDLAVSGHE
ncbi:hypothetical protein [Pseudomonas iridis]|uniref:hypothetical protein n=1 Tax=Pseudomonas iridis TaxID=2710587 RepID=UPI001B31EEBF|nr:hypothetical protein [Pseudomonas iridis]MBP5971047.1 hypothetical protein [Pseudomonas iridis]